MTFFDYLKEQAILGLLLALVSITSYYTSIYLGWGKPTLFTKQDVCIFFIIFIVVGAILRYILKMPPRKLY